MLEVSKSKANKANLDENPNSNLVFDFNIESDSDIKSENETDNDSTSTPLLSLQSSTNIVTYTSNWFANISSLYAQKKLVQILNEEAVVPKQRLESTKSL